MNHDNKHCDYECFAAGGHCSCTRNVLARTQTFACHSCSVRCRPVTSRPGRFCLVRCSWVRSGLVQAGPLWADSSRAGLTGSACLVANLGHKSQNICLYHLLLSPPEIPGAAQKHFPFHNNVSSITIFIISDNSTKIKCYFSINHCRWLSIHS